jgi:hypothetical protein
MTFVIKYIGTSKTIEVSNQRAYLMLSDEELNKLGFNTSDIHSNGE